MLKMIIENDVEKIKTYDKAGIERIFLDLEINGKIERQFGLDTVISGHTINDVQNARNVIESAELLVRINPMYSDSAKEVKSVLEAGADIIMLPMFKTKQEVQNFINLVNGEAKTSLLLETPEALVRIDQILEVDGIDEIHIGLNDLHLSMGLNFMFELMSGSILEFLSNKFKSKGIDFGIGGVSKIGTGVLSAELIMNEHVRLGSTRVILSRSFKQDFIDISNLKRELNLLNNTVSIAMQMSDTELLFSKSMLEKQVESIVLELTKT